MLSKISPSVGKILISEPFMADPNFKRSVILLTEYSKEGIIGFIINQESNLLISDLIPDIQNNFPIFIGGPVAVDTIHYLHYYHYKLTNGIEIADGIFWGNDFEKLKTLINNKEISSDEVKLFLGYSGWSYNQLDKELEENTWIVADQYHKETIFSHQADKIWKEVIINLGVKYAHLSNFPMDPNLN